MLRGEVFWSERSPLMIIPDDICDRLFGRSDRIFPTIDSIGNLEGRQKMDCSPAWNKIMSDMKLPDDIEYS